MDIDQRGTAVPSIECFVNTGLRKIPIHEEAPGRSISLEKLPGETSMTYGQYLDSLARLLSDNSFEVLRNIFVKLPAPAPRLEEASSIELTAEKHGALYSVSRLRVRFGAEARQFAVNCAFSPRQQAFLHIEADLLAELTERFPLGFLPSPLVCAQAPGLKLFIAEWFENHHEFHLSANGEAEPVVKVWGDCGERKIIEREKIPELYAGAANILTSYLDVDSFCQIYPWHHAAGDFILDAAKEPPSLRLVTARGYRSLLSIESDRPDKMLGGLHFFVNLCIRLRLDRLDGVGEPAWAGPECLPGIIRGFSQAWETRRKTVALPEAEEIFSLFQALSPEERLEFAQTVASDGMVEADEDDFLSARIFSCMAELANALEGREKT